MNERIQELALQANSHHDNFFDLNYKELDVFLEKFAELIVRECMEVARPFYMGTPADSVYYVEQAVNRIAEHFGVEE